MRPKCEGLPGLLNPKSATKWPSVACPSATCTVQSFAKKIFTLKNKIFQMHVMYSAFKLLHFVHKE